MNPPSTAQRVAICVCTCKRPKMLERCLKSLISQAVPNAIKPFIIVIENDPAGSAKPAIGRIVPHSPFPIYQRHEQQQGIAIARNAALDAAMEIGADWIAFIDDDEWAEPDWIAELMAPEYLDTPVLQGTRVFEYPRPRPFWVLPDNGPRRGKEGKICKTASTANVRFSVGLALEGLRFDERIGSGGGEDQQFFAEAYRRGWAIRKTGKAVTTETMHPARLTYFGQAYRAYWQAAGNVRLLAAEKGCFTVALRKAAAIPWLLVIGSAEILVSPLFIVAGINAWKRRMLAGGRKIAKGLGGAMAMLGFMPQPYRVIVGH